MLTMGQHLKFAPRVLRHQGSGRWRNLEMICRESEGWDQSAVSEVVLARGATSEKLKRLESFNIMLGLIDSTVIR